MYKLLSTNSQPFALCKFLFLFLQLSICCNDVTFSITSQNMKTWTSKLFSASLILKQNVVNHCSILLIKQGSNISQIKSQLKFYNMHFMSALRFSFIFSFCWTGRNLLNMAQMKSESWWPCFLNGIVCYQFPKSDISVFSNSKQGTKDANYDCICHFEGSNCFHGKIESRLLLRKE